MTSLTRPPRLRPGDRIAVLSASGVMDGERLSAGVARLRSAGLEPVVYPSARADGTFRPYLAGSDKSRADDLRSALTDSSIAGIIFARGGYGAQRVLELMSWDDIEQPKVLAGYSDVTAVLEAVGVRLGWASVHGPTLASDEERLSATVQMLMNPPSGVVFPSARQVRSGVAHGVTCGGNLTMLASSLGTRTSWPAGSGIWLVEEVNEDAYRVDRLLTQLRRSGYLDSVAGIVAGTFTGCGEDPELIEEILTERLGSLGVPMITGANVGHGPGTQPFPLGIAAELEASSGAVRFLDTPLI
jgi:muramoyltetrapeptide carboxypeptidase